MSSTLRVLFFHGLGSSINGRKSLYLAQHFPNSYTPHLKPYYLLPLAFWRAIIAIYHFKPDIIVGTSFGGFITMFLLQRQVWNGNTILLAPATGLLFKKRLWLPKDHRKNIVIVAGRNDKTVPLDGLTKLQQSSRDNIRFLVLLKEPLYQSLSSLSNVLMDNAEEVMVTCDENRSSRGLKLLRSRSS
ncbi:unnamed protein product [Rotaria magnacalcarata]|uniref:Alpha/beta hydrolase n=1 Tax=Rotaria magnacalcarata TaxID=392030 RepID=A0A816A9R3_9BILA|nr:unnamed protein product [Rotaria magnacalcarata]CAF4415261.1 unnamed protein product [Rotaria magnacalcarata]